MTTDCGKIVEAARARFLAACPPRDRVTAWANILEAVAPGKREEDMTLEDWRKVRRAVNWYARHICPNGEIAPSPDVVLLANSKGFLAI